MAWQSEMIIASQEPVRPAFLESFYIGQESDMECYSPGRPDRRNRLDGEDMLDGLDIDHLLYMAHKRFVEGIQTVELLQQAVSEKDKEEIALVALLEVDDNLNLELCCHGNKNQLRRLDAIRWAMLRRGLDLLPKANKYSRL